MELLGKKIKDIRKKRGLAQGELAEMVGIASAHLSRLETGRYKPGIEVLKKLGDSLQVSVDYLLSDSDEESGEVSIQDETFAERIRLLNSLSKEDKKAVIHIIDALLSRKKIQNFLEQEVGAK